MNPRSFGCRVLMATFATCLAGTILAQQQNTPKPLELPSSIDKLKLNGSTQSMVVVIPDKEITKGVSLTDAQTKTLVSNLKAAGYRMIPAGSVPKETVAQQLPGGAGLVSESILIPGGLQPPEDPCAMNGVTVEELGALRQVMIAQIKATGGDLKGFQDNEPKGCARRQLVYYVKSAPVVVK